jgi:hypothetical protein
LLMQEDKMTLWPFNSMNKDIPFNHHDLSA